MIKRVKGAGRAFVVAMAALSAAFMAMGLFFGFTYAWFGWVPEWFCRPIHRSFADDSVQCMEGSLLVPVGALMLPLAVIFALVPAAVLYMHSRVKARTQEDSQ